MTDCRARVRWFLDRLDTPPRRIHTRGVWADQGMGSLLGSPALHREFALWLEAGERAVVTERREVPCCHPALTERDLAAGARCDTCAVYDGEGGFLVQSGRRVITETRYRWPMRAALARVGHVRVRRGFPDLAGTLVQLAVSGGDEEQAASALAVRFPVMGDPCAARAHFARALHALAQRYWEVPIVTIRPRSEAQLDAEAAREVA